MAGIRLYKNNSDNRVINKNLSSQLNYNCDLTEVTSVENPVLRLDNADVSLLNYNYCYIDIFDRYYYCNVSIEGTVAILECNVDVLMSFKNQILNSKALCVRSTNATLSDKADNLVSLKPQMEITYYEFPNLIFVNNNFTQTTKCCTLEILGS